MANLGFNDTDQGDGSPETGKVRANPFDKGKYVIWELEPRPDIGNPQPHTVDHPYLRLAIDFSYDNGYAGMIRYNSTYR